MQNLLTCAVLSVALFLSSATQARQDEARHEDYWQEKYCDGMDLDKHLPSGGYVDCLSSEFAIEVEWAYKWAEGVGQSLYYADATNRKPGFILLCESSEVYVEGLCRSYIIRLEHALQFVDTHIELWECFIDTDEKLSDCTRPELTSNPPAIAAP